MRIVAVINQKGGVAKTTTTANLAHALVRAGHRVTALDLDPQGHLAAYLGFTDRRLPGVDRLLLEGIPLNEVAFEARPGLRLVPAGPRLDAVEQLAEGRLAKSRLLRRAVADSFAGQDFVLLDCPPSSGLLVIFSLYATREVLMPVNGDYLSLHGLSHFLATLKRVEGALGTTIRRHIALTRLHPRRRLARDVIGKLMHYFPGQVLATPIREVAALAECPSFGKTIFEYSANSHGAVDYAALAEDLVSGRTL